MAWHACTQGTPRTACPLQPAPPPRPAASAPAMEGAAVGGTVAERALLALQAGADMILLCNNRSAVDPVLDALGDYDQPVSHGRLAAMRADFKRYAAAPRGSADWQDSVALLREAQEPPPLILDGGVG